MFYSDFCLFHLNSFYLHPNQMEDVGGGGMAVSQTTGDKGVGSAMDAWP